MIHHDLGLFIFFFLLYGDHRDLHLLTHAFPTRRSSDLNEPTVTVRRCQKGCAGITSLSSIKRTRRRQWICCDMYKSPHHFTLSEAKSVLFARRSEEHTSELQSLMRTSYAVFCLKKKTKQQSTAITTTQHTRITYL